MSTPQLTYGCSDGIPGRAGGGWGVLHRSPGLPQDIEQYFLTLVSDDLPRTMPDFPSRQQLADRPVRFRVFPDQAGSASLVCRSIEAGLDETRRPGNVFTHAARVVRSESVRAMDYWFSPDWLSPFGAEQVRLAVPEDQFELPEVTGFAQVAAQFQDESLVRSLPWMIDALCWSVFAGDQVVIVEPDPRKCAVWLGLLSWAISERSAARLAFAVYEDRRTAPLMLDRAASVVGVADKATSLTLDPGVAILDPTWDPDDTRAAVTGQWTLPSGASFPRTEWARLMLDLVWADPGIVSRSLEKREGLAQGLRQLQALPATSEAELAILHLAYLAESQAVELNRQVVSGHLRALPTVALSHPMLRKLAASSGVEVEGTGPSLSQPSVSLSARPTLSAGPPSRAEPPAEPSFVAAAPQGADQSQSPVGNSDGRDGQLPRASSAMLEDRFPTPRSAVAAALALGHAQVSAAAILTVEGFVREFVTSAPEPRVALLRAASQLLPSPQERTTLEAVLSAMTLDETFDRIAPSLLLLACRCHLSETPGAEVQWPVWQALAEHVRSQDAADLAYLAAYFGSSIEVLDSGSAISKLSLELVASRQEPSAWSLVNRAGMPLALVVINELDQAQPVAPSAGRRFQ